MPNKRLLMKKIIIAIDGFSGCGKSSTAKALARHFSYLYIDSGAMYRATTYFFLTEAIDVNNAEQVDKSLKDINIRFKVDKDDQSQLLLNGQPVEKNIRTMEVNKKVSEVSALSVVRREMVRLQQATGKEKGVVMDGRDIGTIVFPDAELKVFMTADLETRARRRQQELLEKGVKEELSEIALNLDKRDQADSSRADSPLVKAVDAIEIDTTNLTFEEQVNKIVKLAEAKMHES